MANPKPFVAVACFCEQVLEEQDGVLSAIRIVDTYTVTPLPPDVPVPPGFPKYGQIPVRGLISLKSGEVVGTGKIGLIMHRSDGQEISLSPDDGWSAVMNGGEHGLNIRLHFVLGVGNLGLVWFDVTWNGEVLTRMPLRLKQAEPPKEPIAPSS